MGYTSKEWRENLFSGEVDQSFLKVHAKNLVRVTKTGKLRAQRDHLLLGRFPSSSAIKIVLLKHFVLIMPIINVIINMDDIRQERSNKTTLDRKGLTRDQF